ncbi:MAG: 23S rRNA (adenine(2503)-C(2))-methyltransferase RlmN [Desulfobacterales bacterium]|nr:23S rRNA (adenine(2503)-C(2))-methyltransferase RlmN [Desulfobacterales bacterium]
MPSSTPLDILEINKEQLVTVLEQQGIEKYRADQILKWVYFRQADTFDAMTDLGVKVRNILSRQFSILRLSRVHCETSRDGTRKYLFRLQDGKHIESVLMQEKSHDTLCISSQVGCGQRCKFCLTGAGGFERNLTRGEMVAQVRDIMNDLESPNRLTNIVFMGMGEPLANYDNLIGALQTITDNETGLRFASRRVTVSTAGWVPKLGELGRDTKVNLAISLNATDNQTRSMLMPINRKYPIEKLLEACGRYILPPGRRITFEYILIKGVNDSAEDAQRLVRLLRPIKAKINLIPLNPHEGIDWLRPEASVIQRFQEVLYQHNYTAIIRYSKGEDISAACGQLKARSSRLSAREPV